MTDFFGGGHPVDEAMATMKERLLDELDDAYPGTRYDKDDFSFSLDRFYRRSGTRFVVVIDEWDAIFRERREDRDGQRRYLDFLRDWLKDKEYVALAYMTGILPIKKYGRHSALNMFDEYSMTQPMQLARYAGFTDDEVRALCNEYDMSYDEVSNWYDGYRVSDWIPVAKRRLYRAGQYEEHRIRLYSPLSVVKAMGIQVVHEVAGMGGDLRGPAHLRRTKTNQ